MYLYTNLQNRLFYISLHEVSENCLQEETQTADVDTIAVDTRKSITMKKMTDF